jgi:ribonuclease III
MQGRQKRCRSKVISFDQGSLQKRIGYSFADPFLLRTATTHRSFGSPHNERLEFLGDGVLNCSIAEILYRRFPELNEGDLSRLRANLVRQDSLHEVAGVLDLGNYLLLGDGERKSGGQARPSILADAMEAVFGAVYLDGGYGAAFDLIARLYRPLIEDIAPGSAAKDAKTRLQELLQGRRIEVPSYTVVRIQGEQHNQEFWVSCAIPRLSIVTEASGRSRRIAEQRAAELALDRIGAKE